MVAKMNKKLIKFFLGFVAIILLFNLGSIKKNDRLENQVMLEAVFKKIDGVQVGSPVMISGITVGRVENVGLSGNYPKVIMKIKKNIKISEDSSISIQTDGLFGSKFLSIEIGGSDKIMVSGDKFSFAEDSILLEELLEKIIAIGEKTKKDRL